MKKTAPWWQSEALGFLPLQKRARATTAILQFLGRIREVTTEAHVTQRVYEAYSEPIFAALKAFEQLNLGISDKVQRKAVFASPSDFGLSFNDQRLSLMTSFEREINKSASNRLIFLDDKGEQLEYHQLPDAEREQHDKETRRQSNYAALEWDKLEAWFFETKRLAELLEASKPEKTPGRPNSAYLRNDLINLLKGKLTNRENLERNLMHSEAKNLDEFRVTREALDSEEITLVVQNLAGSFETYATPGHLRKRRTSIPLLPLDKVLERKVAEAVAKTLDVLVTKHII